MTHLAGFKGVVQVDGYAGYRALAQKGRVSPAFCWSHVRRRFYDRAVAEASPIAHEALQRIAQLYAIEKDIRGRFPDERCAVRQERSRPIVTELEPWLRAKLALISKKSKLAEAIRNRRTTQSCGLKTPLTVILIGSIDLSIGSLVTLTGILTALTVDRLGLFGGAFVGIGAGALVGPINGTLVTMLRVPSFLVTLGVLSILSGVSNHISQ